MGRGVSWGAYGTVGHLAPDGSRRNIDAKEKNLSAAEMSPNAGGDAPLKAKL